MRPSEVINKQLVERYMAACSNGDIDELLDVLAEDAVHYFLPSEMEPVDGAEAIAELWLKVRPISPHWSIDNLISEGDLVVIEYTNVFSPMDDPSSKRINRGTEWYRIENGKIKEIRAYFESDFSEDNELTGYPYASRGYTVREGDA